MNTSKFVATNGKYFFLGNVLNAPRSPRISLTSLLFDKGTSMIKNYGLNDTTGLLKSSIMPINRAQKTVFSTNLRALSTPISQKSYSTFQYKSLLGRMRTNRYSNWGGNRNGYNWKKLKGPLIFTATFCAATTIITPYAYQYTPLKYFQRHPAQLVYGIIGINLAVFGMWRLPQFYRVLSRYFLLEKDMMYSKWAMLGSTFSHQDLWHLGMNMLALYSFGISMASTIGVSNFTMLYLNAGVIASFASLAAPVLLRTAGAFASLGASGSLFGVFGTFAYLIPKATIMFFVIPVPGGAWIAFLGSMVWNGAGLVMRWGSFDYAAHLGGSLVGIFYGWLISTQRKKRIEELRARRSSIW